MQPFPHRYEVTATAVPDGDVHLGTDDVTPLPTATPREFDGPGERWSPESLLVGAVADCFVLTFRGLARKAGLSWSSLECDATGTLNRQDAVTRFTHVHLHASLSVPAGGDVNAAKALLRLAEERCLISRSLNASVHLESRVTVLLPCCTQVQFPQHEAEVARRG
jgi:peroxiredoxin-like protein